MSDMEQSDVVDAAPVAEPVAPEAPSEQTAEELQAEIDELQATIAEQNEAQAPNPQPDPWPVPVIARTPSGESATQQPEAAPEADDAPPSLADATRVLLTFIKAHRTAGDSDLDAAVADVEAALEQA